MQPTAPAPTAQTWLQRGHDSAARGRPEDLLIALDYYDRARAALPPAPSDPTALHPLALAWLNRGNVLQQLGPAHFGAAHTAYDAAGAALASLPLTAERRLNHGALHTNRGRLHLRANELPAARAAFTRALEILRPAFDDPAYGATARRNAAGAALNLAQTHFTTDDDLAAHGSTITSLLGEANTWLAPLVPTDPVAATLALEAARLELILTEHHLTAETFGEFTDRLEAALALALTWLHRDHPTAADLAASLFRLGAFAYARHQPHFLLEFLRDALDPATGPAPFAAQPRFHAIAAEALAWIRADLDRPRALDADDPRAHALAALARELEPTPPWLVSVFPM